MAGAEKGRKALREVHTLPQLVRYLRDELNWPVEAASFEDLDDIVFDWGPDELGIDPKSAAKIEYIKQLRPLEKGQPQGVFFVKFDTRRLPVVALRRILGKLVVAKRATAKAAERPLWNMQDLVFVSSYGEGDARELSFAYFQDADHRGDLPTLKVLGWDNQDTPLHLDRVHEDLHAYLSWPGQPAALDEWRKGWSRAFELRRGEVVTTSKQLSIRLAELARNIRDRIKTALAIETDKGPLTRLMKAFQTALVHDLDADGFADMYAQTIAYGLLSARIADPHKKTADDFAAHMRTNPFLRELMETFLKVGGRRGKAGGPGIDFDELGVSEVVALLDRANLNAVVINFGDLRPEEDPVIHFYELFLKDYDAKKRMQRGVFYTPRPVVSYIVRSVDELLRTEFGLADGLADTTTWGEMAKRHKELKIPEGVSPDQDFVQILDPATGTGTFLVEVIDLIHKTLATTWKAQGHGEKKIDALWNEYVPKHLLTRLHGYELLMAPYAIAHLKIGLKLYETGYRFGTEERARIYLTNALEPWVQQLPLIGFEALAHEAAAVNEIKRRKRFTVVIGNPPYSNFGMLNKNPFILGLLEDYKRGLDDKKINLDDDFIKFVRFSEAQLSAAGVGIHGMITNNAYLDGLTHRRMRQHIQRSFPIVKVVNLHGSSKKKETTPEGTPDENVFDITVGVSIGVLCRAPSAIATALAYADCWGSREAKARQLTGEGAPIRWLALNPQPKGFYFVPKDFSSDEEYRSGWIVTDVFGVWQNGLKTDRDDLFFDFEKDGLSQRMRQFYAPKLDPQFREQYRVVASSSYDIEARRLATKFAETNIRRCLYRPMDVRWLYYEPNLTSRPAEKVMQHMLGGPNLGLIATRQTQEKWDVLATNNLCGHKSCAAYDINSLFPLYLYEHSLTFDVGSKSADVAHSHYRRPNLTAPFLRALAASLQLHQKGAYGLPTGLTPEDIFHYAYAVFHSPGYRGRYAELLKIDFPRLPLTGSLELFRALARLGSELIALHLLESPKLAKPITEFIGDRNPEVEKVLWSESTVWIDKAQTTGFKSVSEDVWSFHIGGYQVCEKWLKDRKGRTLSKDDIAQYQKIVVALSETTHLMKEIDRVIDEHGGWPGAFQAGALADGAEPARKAAEPAPPAYAKNK